MFTKQGVGSYGTQASGPIGMRGQATGPIGLPGQAPGPLGRSAPALSRHYGPNMNVAPGVVPVASMVSVL